MKATAQSVSDDILIFKQKLTESKLPSDGLVLTYDDIPYSAALGATSKFPRDTLAFKWEDEMAETTLQYIEWNTSRTGLINPVAVFEPVEIEGTTINKASLHNVSIVKQLEIGAGDIITVYKANMIIPQVAENLTRSGTAQPPEECAVCKGPTEVIKQREGEALYCTNPNCRARLIGSLVHFCGRDALNIEGVSEQSLEKWVERGFIKDYTDIFKIAAHKEEIINLEGFGEKSYENLTSSIERAKDIALPNFIYALGIRNVGLSNAKLLCGQFNDIEAVLKSISDREALLSIKGFGDIIADSICEYLGDEANIQRIREAVQYLRIKPVEKQEEADRPLAGLSFVVTGNVGRFANRKALQAFIEERGGKCTGSVTGATSYLINNDTESGSAKNKKAKALDIPILSEDMFLEKWGLSKPAT